MMACVPTSLLGGLANGVQGIAGLGWTRISLPSQFSAAFSFDRKFTICLSPSNGVVFFGDGPYVFAPNISKFNFIYTPLVFNPVSTASFFNADASSDYFIGVTLIKTNGKIVPLNLTSLKIDENGVGGTKISTVRPYTIMQTTIYETFVSIFTKELARGHVPRVSPVSPFGACFNSTYIKNIRVGPGVPWIDIVLHKRSAIWSIFGGNSMVKVKDVACLGILDGGVNPITTIVIGGYQLENNLLQFDLADSLLHSS